MMTRAVERLVLGRARADREAKYSMETSAASRLQSSLIPWKKEVLDFLDKRAFRSAELKWQRFLPLGPVENRIHQHLRGMILYRQDRVQEALNVFIETREKYGDNVILHADILQSYYRLNDFPNWQLELVKLHEELVQQRYKVSSQTYHETLVVLAKFYEESGEVEIAWKLYTDSLSILDSRKDRKAFYFYLPQVVRLGAFLKKKEELAEYYRQLVFFNRGMANEYTNIEVQHSMMLAECELVGVAQAAMRKDRILSEPSLSDADRRLITYDFLEEVMRRKAEVESSLAKKEVNGDQRHLDHYEKWLYKLAFQDFSEADIQKMHLEASLISPACYLRLLFLVWQKAKCQMVKEEVFCKFRLLIEPLAKESQNFWKSWFSGAYAREESIEIKVSQSGAQILLRDKVYPIKGRQATKDFLLAFCESRTYSDEELVKRVWNVEMDESYFHRLRMTLRRLNQQILEIVGVAEVFCLSEGRVELAEPIRLSKDR